VRLRADITLNNDTHLYFHFNPGRMSKGESIDTWVDTQFRSEKEFSANQIPYDENDVAAMKLVVRLWAFIALLAHGEDLITPYILSRDRDAYLKANTSDKEWLERKAAKKLGKGHDIGRNLQLDRDRNPHYRNPHLSLFWTGEGRQVPVVKLRKGSLVNKVSMTCSDRLSGTRST